MWALRDASALHGLRCGAYIGLTPAGWQVLGDGRGGRNPHAGSWADGPVHTVTELPPRSALDAPRNHRTRQQTADQAERGEDAARSPKSEPPWAAARVAAAEPTRRTGTG